MHIISRKTLKEAAERYGGIESALDAWFRIANKAAWGSLDDVRKTYPAADGVTVSDRAYTVFNITGNKFRLIVKIEYEYRKVFIKHVLTHAEYDKEDWKK
ncbi:MAG TPA: type II toxin-antitoxin system HigB family toxin [Bryobacteraceae bacterium]|nr:type II toxin-antitoxin system HigB family toxin [Bryobacteraceae bacterium]